MNRLEREKRLDFASAAPEAGLSTEVLFSESRGQMLGVLVCAPTEPGGDNVILKAFSGQYNGVWNADGWVPPILDERIFRDAVAAADPEIKRLSAEIKSCSKASVRTRLIEQRRELSQCHMKEIHAMYTIRNFASGSTDLFTLFADRPGIPAGTGDCCAPKLLNHAVKLGLKPISLAEFFWGRENRSETKKHGCFYPPCEEKCVPILGYMLHGSNSVKGGY